MLDYDRYWDQVRRDKALMDDLEDAHAKLDAATAKLDAATAKLDATTAERDAAVEKLRQTVRNFKAMNLPAEQIAEATGIPLKQLEEF